MDAKEIFASGLGIVEPWYIERIELIGEELHKELHIYLDHKSRSRFSYEGKKYSVYDHQDRTWHHLRFFSINVSCMHEYLEYKQRKVK